MGKTRKPSRKEDLRKAQSLHERYLEHQAKIRDSPDSFSIPHWRREKKQFLSRIEFYFFRAKVKQ
jgi:hypothetical protein